MVSLAEMVLLLEISQIAPVLVILDLRENIVRNKKFVLVVMGLNAKMVVLPLDSLGNVIAFAWKAFQARIVG